MAKNLCDTCENRISCIMQSGIVRTVCGMYKDSKNDLAVDYVSRKAVLEITAETGALETQNRVKALPSVTPIRPKGHWIEYSWNDNGFGRWGLKCDKCLKKYKYGGEMWGHPCFCPNCGAKMESEEI